jgi:DNA-binding NtrC family response regulator
MTGTVLVVDDEEAVRTLCMALVQHLGFRAIGAADGEEALLLFNKDPHAFTWVLLDLTMPRRDGLSTFREMKRLRPDIQVILCSGFSEEDAGDRFGGQGLAGFLQKPYSLQQLRQKIAQAIPTLGRTAAKGAQLMREHRTAGRR